MELGKQHIKKMVQKLEEDSEIIEIPAPPPIVPAEWQEFAGEIEAARTTRPSKQAMDEFCCELKSRLTQERVKQNIIQEYLRETAWRRWLTRGLAAAAMLALAITCEMQREEIESLNARVRTMEQKMADSLPISPHLTKCETAVKTAMRQLAS